MMNGDAAAFRGAIGERADELLRRALAAHIFFQIGKALDEKDRRDDGGIEIVEQDRLIEIEAFQRRFVENQRRPLRHMSRLCIRKERDRRRSFAAMLRPG